MKKVNGKYVPHGSGILIYKDYPKTSCGFENGSPIGKMAFKSELGVAYFGNTRRDPHGEYIPDGDGHYIFDDGRYVPTKHDKGRLLNVNKVKIEDGKQEGFGEHLYESGIRLVGIFHGGLVKGYHNITFKNEYTCWRKEPQFSSK